MKEYLGPAKDYLSVEGEILGMALGVRAIKTVAITSFLTGHGTLTRATILVDCQQAIREVLRVGWKSKSKHSALVGRFHDEVRNMEGMGVDQICLVWVPAHEGIEMNELVDGDAKAAASGDSSTVLISGFQLYPSQSSKFV
jgi:ribonuclease HI